jgi:hypothetical protein
MSIYKDFRRVEKIGVYRSLSKRFDEPTYLSFRLKFGEGDSKHNYATSNVYYDSMPHPLFIKRSEYIPLDVRENYAAIDYLWDANEPTRAEMLKEFIERWNQLQNSFQWYFQKIDGVDALLKTNPKKGQRIPSDLRLTITTLEGLDLRISYLLNLYRKIAWDDVYQRWVLPDMMRYFTLDIYVTEFRTFHLPNEQTEMGYEEINSAKTKIDSVTGQTELVLHALDKILPTWKISCKMCEFDIENIAWTALPGLSVGDAPTPAACTFQIKVGNIEETQIYPVFTSMYLEDKKLNGTERSGDLNTTLTNDDRKDANGLPGNDNRGYNTDLLIGQSREFDEPSHVSGKPFIESVAIDFQGSKNLGTNLSNINPTEPNTWVGNALTFGKSFVTNLVNEKIDKAKMTAIPKLGFSVNEAISAIESKNIITALGLIRKSVAQVQQEYVAPSDKLSDPIVDDTFRLFLTGISQSKATSDIQIKLQEAANTALNDKGVWEKIKDFSKATNLVGEGEINTPNSISGGTNLKQIQETQIKPVSKISNNNPIIETLPSSRLNRPIT